VLAGDAEIGFIEGSDVPAGGSGDRTDELVLVVALGHPWVSRRRHPRAAELAAASLITREPGSGTREAFERALAEHAEGAVALPLLEGSSRTAIKAAVVGGIGPAVLSSFAVAAELSAGTLVRLPVPDLDLRRTLRAVWPAGRTPRGPAGDLLGIAVVRGTA
jgi:DNA-binding transcriptional LysR family regulator